MEKIMEMKQRTEEWFQARLGRVTASRIADMMAKTKSGQAASRKNYMSELMVERLTGKPTEPGFVTKAMERGTEIEPFAIGAYVAETGHFITTCGFINHPTLFAGASPDALVDDDGLAEFKCPNTATHINTLLTGKVERNYILQMQWQMACAERQWCDFVSYDDRVPENIQLKIIRVERDPATIAAIELEARLFLAELDSMVKALEAYRG
jgi:putative phage-type endonuclease